jgi:hypothetical protein
MMTFLLILHSLVGVALLGSVTHQSVSMLRSASAPATASVRTGSFVDRYTGVQQKAFTVTIIVLYLAQLMLGAAIYPAYRLQVRIPFEEMSLGWAIGVFELKEHFAGIGVGILPLYYFTWKTPGRRRDRIAITFLLVFIVWWAFLVGHVLNNIRGLD